MATPPKGAPPGSLRLRLWNGFTRANVALYKVSGGRLGNKISGAPVLVIDHVGRKSGKPRTTPLVYLANGDDLVVVASHGGSDATPAWWLNLKDSPRTSVLVGKRRTEVVARLASGTERERLWPLLVANYADYAAYQTRTERELPVIVLSPVQASGALRS